MNLFQKIAAFAVINTVSYTALAADRDTSFENTSGSMSDGIADTRDLLHTANESDANDGRSQYPQWSQRLGRSGHGYIMTTGRFNGNRVEPYNLSGHYSSVSAAARSSGSGRVTFDVPHIEQAASIHPLTHYSPEKDAI
jgi:hypothetical protein